MIIFKCKLMLMSFDWWLQWVMIMHCTRSRRIRYLKGQTNYIRHTSPSFHPIFDIILWANDFLSEAHAEFLVSFVATMVIVSLPAHELVVVDDGWVPLVFFWAKLLFLLFVRLMHDEWAIVVRTLKRQITGWYPETSTWQCRQFARLVKCAQTDVKTIVL